MFNKKVTVRVMTRLRNEDHIKIQRLLGSWKVSGTSLALHKTEDLDGLEVIVTMNKSHIKSMKKDLDYLNVLGIFSEITFIG